MAENSNLVTVTVPSTLALTKSLIATSETGASDTTGNNLAIGETATYSLSVTLEDGTTSLVTLTDTTPLGMRYVPGVATSAVFFRSADGVSAVGFNSNTVYTNGDEIDAADLTDSTSDTVTGSMVFRFKDVIVPFTNGIDTDAFQVEYTMRAVNVIGNQSTGTPARTNSAVVSADLDGDGDHDLAAETSAPSMVTATIVEPDLTIGKVVTTAGVDAGDPVVYTLTITNAAGAAISTAFDVRVQDLLDTNVELINTTLGSGIVVAGATVDANASTVANLDITLDEIAAGGSVTVVLNTTLKSNVVSGTTIDNTGSITYTSLDGTNANERDGSNGEGAGLNNYADSDSGDFIVATPTIDKLTPSDTTYAIGESVNLGYSRDHS